MSATILDGRATRTALMPGLIEKVRALPHPPLLVIVQVGDRPDSSAYIQGKKSFAEKIGVGVKHVQLKDVVKEDEVLALVNELNADTSVDGIIVQLPLPSQIDSDAVIASIDPSKDVDGLAPENIHDISENEVSVMPATARGIQELLGFHQIGLAGKTVTVIGRSKIVGQPIAAMCRTEGAEVIVCDRSTVDLVSETQKADIIIVAAGHPKLITRAHVKAGQVVVDVGITRTENGLVGDVDFDAVKEIVAAITPVPGGVGPMTVFSLFENLIDLCK
jgi:methylenetetrahydrofolate dehydrogenase (NADP+)/methenyltetrahydrofolate cyclohydrolase